MMRSLTHARTGRAFIVLVTAFSAAYALLGAGCATQNPGGGNGDPNDGDLAGSIVSPTSNFGVSELDALPISVIYSVTGGSPDNIDGYVVEVADANPGSPAIHDRVVVAPDIDAGANENFSFVPAAAGVGFFRVGVLVTQGSEQSPFESTAVIQVQGAPDPQFILPIGPVAVVEKGSPIQVKFDAGDPEDDVQWRLFFLASGDSLTVPPDQLGTQIGPLGSGNLGEFLLQTVNLDPGDYKVGLSATDSGDSIPQTVMNGETSRIVTIPSDAATTPIVRVVPAGTGGLSPTIAFTAPGATDVSLYLNPTFNVQFAVTIREPGVTGTLDVFYDRDRNADNGYSMISQDLAASTTAVALPSNLPEGTHNIGITARDGINAPVTSYAQGRVIFTKTPTLEVSAPNISASVRPGTEVEVKWTTNATANSGTAEVFYHRLTASGQLDPNAQDVFILQNAPISTTSTKFSSATSGLFRVTVRLNFTAKFCVGGTNANNPCTTAGECPGGSCSVKVLTDDAPQAVRVTSLPSILWTGSLATAAPAFEGAIFGGVNFEDNAGSAFSPAGDLNGDGLGDFVVVSRYGKPFFLNATGIGPGEAYVVYGVGGTGKLRGVHNLNSVGTSTLRGVTLTGIRTDSDSAATDGISDVTLVPDADADGLAELAIGFPNTDNREAALVSKGQFRRGGVVILSSDNSILTDPTDGTPVIDLDDVGQRFSNAIIVDRPVVQDLLMFEAGNPDAEPPTEDRCVPGQDGFLDTAVGGGGFIPALAPPAIDFVPVEPPPAQDHCPPATGAVVNCNGPEDPQFPDNNSFGSGIYATTAGPVEPRGARVLGINIGDRFGTSISSSRPLPSGPVDVIFSSPERSDDSFSNSGIAFMIDNTNLWGPPPAQALPKPFQYMMGFDAICSARGPSLAGAREFIGDTGDSIAVVEGVSDFNRDGRGDVAIGAPTADGGRGRLYITYRREEAIEGTFILNKLQLPSQDSERLDGFLVSAFGSDAFGTVVASGFDFNNDNVPDIVVGSPNAAGGVGEIIVLFGGMGVVSEAGGIGLPTLLTTRGFGSNFVAARITGNVNDTNGRFGFNLANAGDLDNDGKADLIVAAPNATPRFDSNPSDSTDVLATAGVDLNADGVADIVPGDDALTSAGLVYVIYGSNRLDQLSDFKICSGSGTVCSTNAQCGSGQTCRESKTVNIEALGGSQLDGLIIAGRRAGDRIGGGDGGDTSQGGLSNKAGRGRSFGLSTAGDVDGDGNDDILIGSVLADPRRDPTTEIGVQNGGEVFLIYSSALD